MPINLNNAAKYYKEVGIYGDANAKNDAKLLKK